MSAIARGSRSDERDVRGAAADGLDADRARAGESRRARARQDARPEDVEAASRAAGRRSDAGPASEASSRRRLLHARRR